MKRRMLLALMCLLLTTTGCSAVNPFKSKTPAEPDNLLTFEEAPIEQAAAVTSLLENEVDTNALEADVSAALANTPQTEELEALDFDFESEVYNNPEEAATDLDLEKSQTFDTGDSDIPLTVSTPAPEPEPEPEPVPEPVVEEVPTPEPVNGALESEPLPQTADYSLMGLCIFGLLSVGCVTILLRRKVQRGE